MTTTVAHRQVETQPPRTSALGRCECGAESQHELPSFTGREYWFKQHRRTQGPGR